MATCCGKERNTNFCPQCGKAMSKEAGLLGLKRYVDSMYEAAQARVQERKNEVARVENPSTDFGYRRIQLIKDAKQSLARAVKKEEQWRDWQEALIKAIDGE
jgi:hypothetical protein